MWEAQWVEGAVLADGDGGDGDGGKEMRWESRTDKWSTMNRYPVGQRQVKSQQRRKNSRTLQSIRIHSERKLRRIQKKIASNDGSRLKAFGEPASEAEMEECTLIFVYGTLRSDAVFKAVVGKEPTVYSTRCAWFMDYFCLSQYIWITWYHFDRRV